LRRLEETQWKFSVGIWKNDGMIIQYYEEAINNTSTDYIGM
jgi:hypothetical protein